MSNSFFEDEHADKVAELQQRSLEILQQKKLPATPLNYALLYAYINGAPSDFNDAIDEILRDPDSLTIDHGLQLFRRYVFNGQAEEPRQYDSPAEKAADDSAVEADVESGNLHAALVEPALLHAVENIGLINTGTAAPDDEPLIDEMTNLLNRNGLDKQLAKQLNDRRRSGSGFSIILCEVDGYNEVNRQHHDEAEDLLKSVADLMQRNTRDSDYVARFASNEFALLLPSTSLNNAYIVAENIRKQVERMPFDIPQGVNLERISLSMGLASHRYGEPGDSLIERGQAAMESAKSTGHNRSYIAE
ncbi:MAG: GGDEF domain-containing protein [Chromatiales bacterium]|jgi:diguanylate cyclase